MRSSPLAAIAIRPSVLLAAAVATTAAAVVGEVFVEGTAQGYGPPSILYLSVVLAALAGGQRAAFVAAPVVTVLYLVALESHGSQPIDLVVAGVVRLTVSLLIGVLIGSAVDQSREMALVAQRQAVIDPLTGLGNRRALETAWERRAGRPSGILMIDMDGLKELNDREGHAAGDHALRTLASALETAVRRSDTVTRIGGDEFVVLADCATLDEVRSMADRIDQHARRAGVAASIGFALAPQDGSDLAEVLAAADIRMYELKGERTARRRMRLVHGGAAAVELED